jgi:hypothetical protein
VPARSLRTAALTSNLRSLAQRLDQDGGKASRVLIQWTLVPGRAQLQGLLRLRSRTWIPRLDYFTATSFTVSCSDQSSILSSG